MAHSVTSRKILIITYYWPPAGGSGVQRWLYFSKHLKALGFTPFVITVHPNYASYAKYDRSLEVEAKDIPVFKTKTREWLQWYSFFKGGHFKKDIPQGAVSKKGFFSKFAAFVRGNFFIPDARKGWVPFAYKKAAELIAKENIPTVITTGPPHSTHLVGLRLKAKFAVKWLADFRDPWSDIFYLKDLYRTSFAQQRDEALEKKVLETADTILTTVSGTFHQRLQQKIKQPQQFYGIYNGYEAALVDVVSAEKPAVFHIAFTGLLTANQPYQSIVEALQKVCANFSDTPIRFSLAGSIDARILVRMKAQLPKIEIVNHGYIVHSDAIRLMKSAHLLINFIFGGTQNTQMISGKLTEYMATGTPILSLGDKHSEAGQFLSKASHATMISEQDIPSLQKFMETLLTAWENGKPLSNEWKEKEQYTRLALSRKLVVILENL